MRRQKQYQAPFITLLNETFGAHDLPEQCSVSLAREQNQDDFGDLIAVIDECGQREGLKARLSKTHPIRKAHLAEHDDDFWNVWTEAQALAWAATIGGYASPEFTDDLGKPDIFALPETWIEAKTIRMSPEENAVLNHMAQAGIAMRGPSEMVSPHRNLLHKFEDGLQRAVVQGERQQAGQLTAFFNLEGIDWPVSPSTARAQIARWAQRASRRSGVRIVVCSYGKWSAPLIDVPV
jgi:hypothetical protein